MKLCTIRQTVWVLLFSSFLLTGQPAAAQGSAQNHPSTPIQKSLDIPIGTILPVRVNQHLSSRTSKPGQAITGRIMQAVPLPNGGKIPEGSSVEGKIVSVQPAANGAVGKITFRMENLMIHQQSFPILVNLRALAGFVQVRAAETPQNSLDFGTPDVWATTEQIGGDIVYGVDGPVTDQWNHTVGKSVYNGVLVHVRAQPDKKCRGPLDAEDRLQALWVFSSDACGVYGTDGVTIAHTGRTEPAGEIALSTAHGDVLVRGASAMLLRVNR